MNKPCYEIKESKKAMSDIFSYMLKNNNYYVYHIVTDKAIAYNNNIILDRELCKNLGYFPILTNHKGGCIVTNPGDFTAAYIGGEEFLEKFPKYFINYLKGKNLNAEISGNDFLIDGYKVGSMSFKSFKTILKKNIGYTVLFIGINTNLEDIKKICIQKPINKIPKGLSEYNITTEEIKELFLNFVNGEE